MRLRVIALLAMLLAVYSPISISVSLRSAVAATPAQAQTSLQLFSTESAAQAHCPRDVVVWLNTPTGIYHLKGERWYANTKHGAFVCKHEADAAGDRETRNGQ
jgi:hypothetical protein